MDNYQKFFSLCRNFSLILRPRNKNRVKEILETYYSMLEIVEIVQERTQYIIFARLPGSFRTFKFSLRKNGEIRGVCHDRELIVSDFAQKTIRHKFACYMNKNPSYYIYPGR